MLVELTEFTGITPDNPPIRQFSTSGVDKRRRGIRSIDRKVHAAAHRHRPWTLTTTSTTMSSSTTPFASSSDHSFFSKSKYSAVGSSTVVTTRVVAVPRPPNPRAGAPAIKVTAQSPSSAKPFRETDVAKRKSEEDLLHAVHKKRRVTPEMSNNRACTNAMEPQHRTRPSSVASSSTPSTSSRQTSAAPSPLANEVMSSPSTRATSVVSAATPSIPARECWIVADGRPGTGFLSSESVVQDLMKGYKACEYALYTTPPSRRDAQSVPCAFPLGQARAWS